MADGIEVTHQVRSVQGSLVVDTGGDSFTATQTTKLYSAGAQVIGFAAHEAIVVGSDVTTAGVAYFKNLDTTNYVDIGTDVAGVFKPFMRLYPGESYPVRLAVLAIYAKANVAAVNLQFWINAL